jgi:hypothetical protein
MKTHNHHPRRPLRRFVVSSAATLLLFAVCSSGLHRNAHAQNTQPTAAPANSAAAASLAADPSKPLVVDNPNYDFGEFWPDAKLYHEFILTNNGEHPVEILSVKPSCGCTVAETYDRVIAPGSIGKIPVSLKPEKVSGKFQKNVNVTTDLPSQSSLRLTVKGNARKFIEIEPRFFNFGTIQESDSASTLTVKVTNNADDPIKLTLNERTIPGQLDISIIEKVPGKEWDVQAALKQPIATGRIRGAIRIGTDSKLQPQITISAAGMVVERLSVQPKEFFIPRPMPRDITRRLIFTNNGGSDVEVKSVSTTDEKLDVSFTELKKGRRYQITIEVPSGYLPENNDHKIVIHTSDEARPEVEVPIYRNVNRNRNAAASQAQRARQTLRSQSMPSPGAANTPKLTPERPNS